MPVSSLGASGFSPASTIALRGVTAAAGAFDAAAQVVSRAATKAPPGLSAAPALSAGTGAGLLNLQEGLDLTAASVAGMVAQRAYEMNLNVLRSTDEMAGAALQMLG